MKEKVLIVGCGHVGEALIRGMEDVQIEVVGVDKDEDRVNELNEILPVYSYSDLFEKKFVPTVIIVTVQTPVDSWKEPDLHPVMSAAVDVGRIARDGTLIVLESTVVPGTTQNFAEVVKKNSQAKDLQFAYSPERVNPGDRRNTLATVTKVIGTDLDIVRDRMHRLYAPAVGGIVHCSILEAEMCKLLENVQRDCLLAFANEMNAVCNAAKISFQNVIKAASTKWNWAPCGPGLVGGHCIPIDPYYVRKLARTMNISTLMIDAAREVNDGVVEKVSEAIENVLSDFSKRMVESTIVILGVTYKPDVNDVRNSGAAMLVNMMLRDGARVIVCDPVAKPESLEDLQIAPESLDLEDDALVFCNNPLELPECDALILAVPHKQFLGAAQIEHALKIGTHGTPIVFDLYGAWSSHKEKIPGYLTL